MINYLKNLSYDLQVDITQMIVYKETFVNEHTKRFKIKTEELRNELTQF